MGSRHGVRPAPSEEDAEESQRGQGKAFAHLPPKGEDPFRCYSREIGKVPLLTAEQEVKIGRRIEIGQIALRQALAGIPMAVRALLEMGDRLRRGETAAADVIVLPEGGGPCRAACVRQSNVPRFRGESGGPLAAAADRHRKRLYPPQQNRTHAVV